MRVASHRAMEGSPRVLTLSAVAVCAAVMAIASCTRTTDRVVEPVGGGDASTTSPALGDAAVGPIGPLALPPPADQGETGEDFRLVRAPEFGAPIHDAPRVVVHITATAEQSPGLGGSAGTAGNGIGGNDRRPVSSGGGPN